MRGLLALLACGGGPSQAEVVRSLAQLQGREAFEACAGLVDADARGHCQVTTIVEVVAAEGLDAHSLCRDIQTEAWRDECTFLAVDTSQVVGERARAVCETAGVFVTECHNHAVLRELKSAFAAYVPGAETALYEAAVTAADPYAAGLAPEPAEAAAGRHVVHFLGGRARDGQPFGPQHCGDLAPELCARVYWESMPAKQRSMTKLRRICGLEVRTAEAVAAAGARSWEAAVDGPVKRAWRDACERPPPPPTPDGAAPRLPPGQ